MWMIIIQIVILFRLYLLLQVQILWKDNVQKKSRIKTTVCILISGRKKSKRFEQQNKS